MVLSTITLKYTPSNSIAIAHNGSILGVGAGQQNRVDCIKLAGRKADVWRCYGDIPMLAIYSLKSTLKRPEKINNYYTIHQRESNRNRDRTTSRMLHGRCSAVDRSGERPASNTADDITLSSTLSCRSGTTWIPPPNSRCEI